MADNQKTAGEPVSERATPAMALLLEAESKADEIVNQAQNDAELIAAEAKRRAKQILDAAGPPQTGAEASRMEAELEKQKDLIMTDARRRMEALRSAATARLAEAVEKVVAALVGES